MRHQNKCDMLRNEGKGHFCSFFGTQCQNYLLFLKLAKNGKGGWSKPPHLKIIPSIPGREGDRFLTTATLGMGGTDRGGVLAEAAHGVGLPHPHRRCEVLPHAQQQRGAEQPPPVVHLDPAGDQVGEGEVTPPPPICPPPKCTGDAFWRGATARGSTGARIGPVLPWPGHTAVRRTAGMGGAPCGGAGGRAPRWQPSSAPAGWPAAGVGWVGGGGRGWQSTMGAGWSKGTCWAGWLPAGLDWHAGRAMTGTGDTVGHSTDNEGLGWPWGGSVF